MELFKIVESEFVSQDTLIIVSPLTIEEARHCATIYDLVKVLFEKKKVVVLTNLKQVEDATN